ARGRCVAQSALVLDCPQNKRASCRRRAKRACTGILRTCCKQNPLDTCCGSGAFSGGPGGFPFPSTTTEPESTTTTTTTSTTMPGGCTPGDPRGCAATECCNPSTHMCCDPFAPGCGFLVNSCCGPVPLQADFCGGPGSPAVCPVMSCQLGMIYKCV